MGRDLIDKPPRGFVSSIKRPVLNIKDRSADAIFIPMSFHQVKIKLNS